MNNDKNKKQTRRKIGFYFLLPCGILGATAAISIPLILINNNNNNNYKFLGATSQTNILGDTDNIVVEFDRRISNVLSPANFSFAGTPSTHDCPQISEVTYASAGVYNLLIGSLPRPAGSITQWTDTITIDVDGCNFTPNHHDVIINVRGY